MRCSCVCPRLSFFLKETRMSQHARSSLSASAVRLTYLTSLTNLLFALIGAFVGWMTSSYVVQSEVPHDFTDALVLFLAARMFSTRPGLQRFLLWVVAVGYLYAAIGAGVMLWRGNAHYEPFPGLLLPFALFGLIANGLMWHYMRHAAKEGPHSIHVLAEHFIGDMGAWAIAAATAAGALYLPLEKIMVFDGAAVILWCGYRLLYMQGHSHEHDCDHDHTH